MRAPAGLAIAAVLCLAPCSVRPVVAAVSVGESASGHAAASNPGTRVAWAAGRVIDHVQVDEPLIALTFDDGPREPYTSAVLDILADAGVRATFFLIGENVRRHPEVARRIVREGHAVGNHTLTHRSLSRLPDAEVVREIRAAAETILAITGARTWLLRPPYGATPRSLTGSGGLPNRTSPVK